MADLGNLKELNNIVTKVIELIKSDMDLCKYIKYDSESPLNEPDFKPSTLIKSYIYPLPKVPDANSSSSTFVNVYIRNYVPSRKNRSFSIIAVNIDIMSHLDLWMIDDGIRPYCIASKIDKLMKSTMLDEAYSITELDAMDWKVFSDSYHGYRLTYEMVAQR